MFNVLFTNILRREGGNASNNLICFPSFVVQVSNYEYTNVSYTNTRHS